MVVKEILAVMLLFSVVASDMPVRYDNYAVLRLSVNGSNVQEVDMYREMRNNDLTYNISFWSDRDIQVGPVNVEDIKNKLEESGITVELMIKNVQELIDSENNRISSTKPAVFGGDPDPRFFADYQTNANHVKFIDDIVSTYSSIATKVHIGKTYEGNDIWGVVVSGKSANTTSAAKPGIYYEGGIHSREWIAQSTVAYMMYHFTSQYGKDSRITKLVDALEWTFVPVLNVDGYLYTWKTDRMWRKTRSPNSGSSCIGTDPNRNWDSHWCEEGASKNPCSESYCGSAAFTEKCVKASADYVKAHTNIQGFIDFHSYSQLWMRPYGYTGSEPADYRIQQELGRGAVSDIKSTYGMTYQEGSIYKIIYPASGSSCDYIYDSLGRKFPYGVELRDTGRHGFILPPDQIIPTGDEILAAAKGMGEYVLAHL